MMLRILRLAAVLILFSGAFVFSGCEITDDEEMYSIEIIGTDGSFHGWYKTDGDDMIFFDRTDAEMKSGGFYYFKKNLGSLTSLRVMVSGYEETAGLDVFINQNDDIVKEGTSSRTVTSSGEISLAKVSLTYRVDGDND